MRMKRQRVRLILMFLNRLWEGSAWMMALASPEPWIWILAMMDTMMDRRRTTRLASLLLTWRILRLHPMQLFPSMSTLTMLTRFLPSLGRILLWTPVNLDLDMNLQFHLRCLILPALPHEADHIVVNLHLPWPWTLRLRPSTNLRDLKTLLLGVYVSIVKKFKDMVLNVLALQEVLLFSPMKLNQLFLWILSQRIQQSFLRHSQLRKSTPRLFLRVGPWMTKATFNSRIGLRTFGKSELAASFGITYFLGSRFTRSRRLLIQIFPLSRSILTLSEWRSQNLLMALWKFQLESAKELIQGLGLEWLSTRSLVLPARSSACTPACRRRRLPRTLEVSSLVPRRRRCLWTASYLGRATSVPKCQTKGI